MPPHSDNVVMETTYGNRLHKSIGSSVDELFGAIAETFKRGGNVIIPTFAVERAQELLYFLSEGINKGRVSKSTQVFLDSPMGILMDTCLDPKYLELELTETVLMRQTESTTYVLGQLKAIGVRLTVDDFGTGYSSLSYLTRFPIDSLKLDQSFVHNIMDKSNDAIVIRAVICMAKSLKQSVIAEGVETIQQLEFLRAHGCDEGQGHYFSRPTGAQQFAHLLEMPCQQLIENNGVILFHHDTRLHHR